MVIGLSRDKCLDITGLSKHQFYRPVCAKKLGRQGSVTTRYKDPLTPTERKVSIEQVLEQIIEIKSQPDLPNWYRMITRHLQLAGYYINHKKVYRLMEIQGLLEEPRKRTGRNFIGCRCTHSDKQP